ncbi:MAG: hypothetical protein ACJ76I_11935 [Gaiellaceae bacterium]
MNDSRGIDYPPTEAEKVEAWRLETLLDAGCPVPIAERIAHAVDVDLHQAANLLAHGCPAELAAEILL